MVRPRYLFLWYVRIKLTGIYPPSIGLAMPMAVAEILFAAKTCQTAHTAGALQQLF
jgi:hypothetical protein